MSFVDSFLMSSRDSLDSIERNTSNLFKEFRRLENCLSVRERPIWNFRGDISSPKTSGVYFLGVEGFDFVKIGHAKNIRSRKSSNQTGCPFPLYLICFITKLETYHIEGEKLEHNLHREFWDQHARGEWFLLDRRLVDFLRSLRSENIKGRSSFYHLLPVFKRMLGPWVNTLLEEYESFQDRLRNIRDVDANKKELIALERKISSAKDRLFAARYEEMKTKHPKATGFFGDILRESVDSC